jgi:hypothetical protein
MRVTQFNCPRLQWSRPRPTIRLSGYAAGHQKNGLFATALPIRANVHTSCHINQTTARISCLLKSKSICRASSTLSAKPTTSTLPSTISGDATVKEVTEVLTAHGKDIEASRKTAAGRRELASASNIGLQALIWLKQLDGLDEQHVVDKELSGVLSWLLVAEGNEQPLISWLFEEGSRMKSKEKFVKRTKANYHTNDAYGNRYRRRHDLLAALIHGNVALSLDGTAADAISCLRVVVSGAIRLRILHTLGLAGPLTVLARAVRSETASPISVSLFEDYLNLVSIGIFAAEHIAEAKLFHPVAPDPSPMFRRMEGDMARLLAERQSIRQIKWNKLGLIYLRVVFLLQLEGATVEADDVIRVLKEHFATVWHNRQVAVDRLNKDPKLKDIIARNGTAAIDQQ